MRFFSRVLAPSLLALAFVLWGAHVATPTTAQGDAPPASKQTANPGDANPVDTLALPPEARETLRLIRRGGPFPYDRDGSVFGNYEKRLPARERGYYREYTVKTPRAHDRGARRIIAGGCRPGQPVERGSTSVQDIMVPCATAEWYYTDDHYRSFHRIPQ